MGNYDVGKKLNLLFNIPYVTTQTSAGTLHGMHGVHDLSDCEAGLICGNKVGIYAIQRAQTNGSQ